MALETFAPSVSPSSVTDTPEVKILKADFGDGYSQSGADGLNHIRSVRNVTWDVLTVAHREEIIGFFQTHGGFAPFYYRFHDDTAPMKWTVEKWSKATVRGGYHKVEAEFRQSFSLAT